MNQPTSQSTLHSISQRTITIYRWAVYATFAFVFAGIAIALFSDHDIETEMGSPANLISKMLDLNPSGSLGIGIGIMILAPIVMVADAALSFYRGGDKRFALITCAVALILAFSILISFIWG